METAQWARWRTAHIIGSIRKDYGAAVNESFLYALGDADEYSPMRTTDVNGTGNMTASGNSNFSNWAAGNQFAPTAANVYVSGRVIEEKDIGIARAQVSITNSLGQVRTATTNQFGYFRFDDIAAGQVYVFDVRSKEYSFVPQVLNNSEDVRELILTAQ